jgi:hypothetical protein
VTDYPLSIFCHASQEDKVTIFGKDCLYLKYDMEPTTPDKESNSTLAAPDCTECSHYFITHEAGVPYGCRKFGFKSARKPMLDVLEASGERCFGFEKRR